MICASLDDNKWYNHEHIFHTILISVKILAYSLATSDIIKLYSIIKCLRILKNNNLLLLPY